jgi:hypothetical protein
MTEDDFGALEPVMFGERVSMDHLLIEIYL